MHNSHRLEIQACTVLFYLQYVLTHGLCIMDTFDKRICLELKMFGKRKSVNAGGRTVNMNLILLSLLWHHGAMSSL